MTPQNHMRLVLFILLLLGLTCAGCGTYLLVVGYQSGELFVGIVGTVVGALAGMISMRGNNSTHPPTPPTEPPAP